MGDRLNMLAAAVSSKNKNAISLKPKVEKKKEDDVLTEFLMQKLTERISPNKVAFSINVITNSNPELLLTRLSSDYPKAMIKVFSQTTSVLSGDSIETLENHLDDQTFGHGKLNLVMLSGVDNPEIPYVQAIKKLIAGDPSSTYLFSSVKVSRMNQYDKDNGKLGNPTETEDVDGKELHFYEIYSVDIKSPKVKKPTPPPAQPQVNPAVKKKSKPEPASGSGLTQEQREQDQHQRRGREDERMHNPVKKPSLDLSLKATNIPARDKGLLPTSSDYQDKFRKYIRSVLEAVVLDSTPQSTKTMLLESLTEPTTHNNHTDVMLIWRLAFTHTSANPDPQGNYDQLEAIGDRMLSAAFKDFSAQKYPRITDTELNEYNSRYMSEEVQGPMGAALKMASWLIVDPIVDISFKFNEDLFESFCGALTRLADIIKGGLGYVMVRHMIETIFGPINYDERYRYGKSITLITQAYNSQHWYDQGQSPTLEIMTDKRGGEWIASIDITSDNFVSYLQNERKIRGNSGPHINTSGIKASAKALTKDAAKDLVSDMVVERLRTYGVTPKDLVEKDLRRSYLYRTDPEYQDMVDRVLNTSNSYRRVYIETIKSTDDTNKNYSMLIGERTNGNPNELGILDKLAIQANPTNQGLSQLDINTSIMNHYLTQ